MTITVTVSEFRDNLAKYLDLLVGKKAEVELVDGRKGKVVANLINRKKKKFDWDEYIAFVEGLAGSGLLASKEDELARNKLRKATNKRLQKARKF